MSALLDYLGKRGGSPGPLFLLENDTPLHRRYSVSQIQSTLSSAGIHGSSFNGHSFRIGAATTASAAGIPEATIKVLGRWKGMAYSLSSHTLLYTPGVLFDTWAISPCVSVVLAKQ